MPGRASAGSMLTSLDPYVSIPGALLNDVMPHITSIEEIQVLLACLRLWTTSNSFTAPLAERSIVRDSRMRASLRVTGSPREPDRRIAQGLDLNIARGTLLRLVAESSHHVQTWYFIGTTEAASSLELMARGVIPPPRQLWNDDEVPGIRLERPNAFRLYEQNIGPLTPLIADQITKAIESYPADWIQDAMSESVAYNRRNWRYVMRILENWRAQGRDLDRS